MTLETPALVLFLLYSMVVFLGSLAAVLARNLVRALLGLILCLFGVAGMYLLMNAPFLALMQLLIYVGAVSVLIFFAIMLTRGQDADQDDPPRKIWTLGAALAAGILPALAMAKSLLTQHPPLTDSPVEESLAKLGQGLLDEYILAFELISVVLFAAMAGAVLLGFERRTPK